jgi:hypothetical protein
MWNLTSVPPILFDGTACSHRSNLNHSVADRFLIVLFSIFNFDICGNGKFITCLEEYCILLTRN